MGRVHPARAGRRFRTVRSLPRPAARSRSHQGGRRPHQGQQAADDLCRQRRDPCARGNPRTRRNDRRACGGVPQRPRYRLQRARARADDGGGLQIMADHRSDDRDRHTAGAADDVALALSTRRPEVDPDRYRSDRDASVRTGHGRDCRRQGRHGRSDRGREKSRLQQDQWSPRRDPRSHSGGASGDPEDPAADGVSEHPARGAAGECHRHRRIVAGRLRLLVRFSGL